jgi:hypothetical protein
MANSRKQFQLNILNNKLQDYQSRLLKLQNEKNGIIQNSAITNNITSNDSIINDKDTNNKKFLEQREIELKSQLEQLKREINSTRSNQARTVNTIKLLPNDLQKSIIQEKLIYEEECLHLDGKLKEAEDLLQTQMNQQIKDKLALEIMISSLQQQIATASQNITEIQANAHEFRKGTIQALKDKKQQKKQIQQQITTIQDTHQKHLDNHSNLLTANQSLLEYKNQIINNYYAHKDQNNICESIKQLELEGLQGLQGLPELVDNRWQAEDINKIIEIIDDKINDNTNLANLISIKESRNNKRNNQIIQQLHSNMQPYSRSQKVISYKDNFKLAKLEKTNLEDNLSTLQKEFDNWDITVIAAIQNNYHNTINQIEDDRTRALERINIMTSRLNTENEEIRSNLERQITILTEKLININNNIQSINLQIADIKCKQELLDMNQTTLEKLNTKITEIENAIQLIEKDIASIV